MGKMIPLLALVAIAVVAISGCTQSDNAQQPVNTIGTATTYTLADVAMHNSGSDCWLAIDGRVYDVTSFIPSHPGGQAILQGCGTDATTLFETRPMGSGTPHSQRARSLLANYYIGDLSG